MLLREYIENRIISEVRGELDIDNELVSDILSSFFVFNFMKYILKNSSVLKDEKGNKELVYWLYDRWEEYGVEQSGILPVGVDHQSFSRGLEGDQSYFAYNIQNDDEVQNCVFLSAISSGANKNNAKRDEKKIGNPFYRMLKPVDTAKTRADYARGVGDAYFNSNADKSYEKGLQKLHYSGLIRIHTDIESLFNVFFYSDSGLEDIKKAINGSYTHYFTSMKHELIHHQQYFSQRRLNNKNYGFHAKKKSYTAARSKEEKQIPHFARDIEFWPVLSNEKLSLLQKFRQELNRIQHFRKVRAKDINDLFEEHIKNRSFFVKLKKHSPVKYRKAVNELYKATVNFYKEVVSALDEDIGDNDLRTKAFEFIATLLTDHTGTYERIYFNSVTKAGSVENLKVDDHSFNYILRNDSLFKGIEDKEQFKSQVEMILTSIAADLYKAYSSYLDENDEYLSKEEVIELLEKGSI